MTEQFILPAQEIFHAQSITATVETRYYLQGVYIEPIADGGALAVATDGHIMLIQRLRKAVAPRPAILQFTAPRLAPDYDEDDGSDLNDPISWGESLITIDQITPEQTIAAPCHWLRDRTAVRFHVIVHEISGTFPDWRKAAGAQNETPLHKLEKQPRETMLDPVLLTRLAGPFRGIKLHQIGHPSAGAVITFEDAPDALGVITRRAQPAPAVDPLRSMLLAIGRAELIP